MCVISIMHFLQTRGGGVLRFGHQLPPPITVGPSRGGGDRIDDLIKDGTFSFQKCEVRKLYQHSKWGETGLPVRPKGYWRCTLVEMDMGCH